VQRLGPGVDRQAGQPDVDRAEVLVQMLRRHRLQDAEPEPEPAAQHARQERRGEEADERPVRAGLRRVARRQRLEQPLDGLGPDVEGRERGEAVGLQVQIGVGRREDQPAQRGRRQPADERPHRESLPGPRVITHRPLRRAATG